MRFTLSLHNLNIYQIFVFDKANRLMATNKTAIGVDPNKKKGSHGLY